MKKGSVDYVKLAKFIAVVVCVYTVLMFIFTHIPEILATGITLLVVKGILSENDNYPQKL